MVEKKVDPTRAVKATLGKQDQEFNNSRDLVWHRNAFSKWRSEFAVLLVVMSRSIKKNPEIERHCKHVELSEEGNDLPESPE